MHPPSPETRSSRLRGKMKLEPPLTELPFGEGPSQPPLPCGRPRSMAVSCGGWAMSLTVCSIKGWARRTSLMSLKDLLNAKNIFHLHPRREVGRQWIFPPTYCSQTVFFSCRKWGRRRVRDRPNRCITLVAGGVTFLVTRSWKERTVIMRTTHIAQSRPWEKINSATEDFFSKWVKAQIRIGKRGRSQENDCL